MTTIRAQRSPWAVFRLLLCLAFLALGAWKLSLPDEFFLESLFVSLYIAFWVLCAAANAWMIFRPDRLTLDGEGFTQSGFFGATERVHWADVEAFHVAPRRNPKRNLVGWTYLAAPDASSPAPRADGFDEPWELGADDLAALLRSHLEASRK